MRWYSIAGMAVLGCSSSESPPPASSAPPPRPAATARANETATSAITCRDPVLVIENGVERDTRCPKALDAKFTILDLRDAWTPRMFGPGPEGSTPAYRDSYLAIAAERDEHGKPLPASDALEELYGIVPSLAVVRARFAQGARYRCHTQIDSSPIASLARPYGQEHEAIVKFADYSRRAMGARLEKVRVARKLPDFTPLAADPELGPIYQKWKAAQDLHDGVVAAQKHLVCEGYLSPKQVDGLFTWRTGHALELFQRRNFLLPDARLDTETRKVITTDPRELDYRFALRILRERVVDATGLIEDGTAGDGPTPIMNRMLDPEAMRGARGHEKALPNAAPDLVSPATDTAARQLGWTDASATMAFLNRHPGGLRVAVELPPVPAYHSTHMDLNAVIDRGDVFYDPVPVARIVAHRPNLVLYVNDNGTKRPLVRWPTTIGGWSDVRIGGGVVKKWKESDVGPRVWKDLYAAPTWLPPLSTPDSDLMKWTMKGWKLKTSILGPGPHGAFGMMLLPHYYVYKDAAGREHYGDNGIGTHGSATVMSIVYGHSHGCHRMFNQLAVRLGDFLLAHRNHVVKGDVKEYYRRMVRYKGRHLIKIDTRGYDYQFTPPVPVEVTKGTIRSRRKFPPTNSAPAGT